MGRQAATGAPVFSGTAAQNQYGRIASNLIASSIEFNTAQQDGPQNEIKWAAMSYCSFVFATLVSYFMCNTLFFLLINNYFPKNSNSSGMVQYF